VARGLRLNGRRAWLALSGLLAAGALAGWFVPAALWDWQPARAFAEPWRALTAAFVHWSELHLAANLLATAVVAAFGVVARVPARAAAAWSLAWPLTHGLLLAQPALVHYGGLSGVLHAGVAVVLVELLCSGPGPRRTIAAMVSVGVAVKLFVEAPWGDPLRREAGWDIALAPAAHAAGIAAGVACAIVLRWLLPRQSPDTNPRGHR
jgi:rhomboid family GlyGly-CTERM serine protease